MLCAAEMEGTGNHRRPVSIIDDEHMYYDGIIRFTKKFPNTVFCIDAHSNDQEMERYYYKNGKCQECYPTIIFPEFDETKLK